MAKKKKTSGKKAPRPRRPSSGRRSAPDAISGMPMKRVSLKRLNPAPYNPRKTLRPGDSEFEKLAKAMDEFGLVEPLVWNKRTGNLVGGHQRMAVLKHRNVTSAMVVVVDLEPNREKALNLALNKIGSGADMWDQEKLAALVDELVSDDSIDEMLTGFDENEIKDMLADLDADGDGAGGSGGAGGRAKMPEQLEYRIIVECTGEKHQLKLLRQFEKEGLICRPVIS